MKTLSRLCFIFTGLLIMICLISGCSQEEPAKQPNIIFAIADDWGWPHAGVYGDPVVQTPAFDRVASEGVLFNQAYVSSPSCTPSRNAILTGQYHWRLGPGANLWSTLDPSTPVFPLILEQAGYQIGQFRKSWGPGNLEEWKEEPAGKKYPDGFETFLAEWDQTKPFCFWLGSWDPHRPYEEGTGVKSGMDPEKIRLYECFPDDPVVRSDVADYYYEVQRFDTLVMNTLRSLEKIGQLENTIIVVTGDNGMPFPRCKSNIYDAGVRVPLAIRWGSGIKSPDRIIDDFTSMVDMAPTFLELAGVDIPEVMTGKSLVGLLKSKKQGIVEPELRGYVLHGKERHVPGQEENLGGYPCRAIRNHDFLYIRNFKPDRWPAGTPDYGKAFLPNFWLADCDNGPTKTYMVENRDKDDHHRILYELSFGKRPGEELYDCRKDPGQLVNLADDPAYADIRESMSDLLMEQLKLTSDPRVMAGGDKFDEYPYLGGGPMHPDSGK
jgi:N-sulfoglucosamine sulfohydrolase